MRCMIRMIVISAAAVAVASCQSGVDLSKKVASGGPQAETSVNAAELAYELAQQTWCSNDQACSMVLLMVDGEDRCSDFEQRLAALQAKGLAGADWRLESEKPVTKGTVAYMVCRGVGIKQGLMMCLLPCRRYAYRDAAYHGLITSGSPTEPLTGPEVVGIMGRAARMKE